MATGSVNLDELVRQRGADPEFLRQTLEWLLQPVMEAEVRERIGADRYDRTPDRTTYRNGHRPREWDTRLGTLHLAIPKLRQGSYFPGFLEPRKRSEQALVSVIQEAYVNGVSTRKVDQLVQALGLEGVSKSTVSRIAQELDARITAFRERPLDGRYPSVGRDARTVKVRDGDRVFSMALVVAIGVRDTGEREVLGFDCGWSEEAAFWTDFLRRLRARGLSGVLLVISDAHQGLQKAIQTVFQGVVWQRCRVHFLRNLLSTVPRSAQALGAALVRTIFAQATQVDARHQLQVVRAQLHSRFPAAAALLDDAAEDILAYMAFPPEHWRQLHSTNPLERLNRELARRCDVVGIFPNAAAVLRLAGAGPPRAARRVGHRAPPVLQPDLDGEATTSLPGDLDSSGGGSVRSGQHRRKRGHFPPNSGTLSRIPARHNLQRPERVESARLLHRHVWQCGNPAGRCPELSRTSGRPMASIS
jgi:transposase-like protein